MCRGEFSSGLTWNTFADAANSGKDGFAEVPRSPGVYVLRVAKVGDRNVERIREQYLSSPFVAALDSVDQASEGFFQTLGIGTGWGWRLHPERQRGRKRLERLDRLPLCSGRLTCRILYIGCANDLRRRMWELTSGGHTINHPFWALLNAGWAFEMAIVPVRPGDETGHEALLKKRYRLHHGDLLPALVHR